ncbi:hypothetical protein IPM19_03470 [bacterium]|nr:MAG: hypothetical protein IPM19_03470 [bacterium]
MKVIKYNSGNSDSLSNENDFDFVQEFTQEEMKIVEMLSSIPKSKVPTPTKQYRFAQQKPSLANSLLQFLSGNKLVTFTAVFALMLVGAYTVVQSAEDSLPGQRLYSIKRAGEEARINLTFNKEKAANLHLALAEKRLEETKRVIESNDPKLEAAAITALTNQTEKTFEAVSQMATAKAVSENDTTLLSNLVAINKQQKTVLESAGKTEQSKETAAVALSATKQANKAIAMMIATVNEQILLDLPNKISITGDVTSYAKNKLVIEKNSFIINDATILLDESGDIVEKYDKLEGKITVIGTKDNNTLIAKKIIIIDGLASLTPSQPQVKGTATVTPKPETKAATQPTTTPTPKPETKPEQEPSTTEPQKPAQAQAGFILEPSDSQYAP